MSLAVDFRAAGFKTAMSHGMRHRLAGALIGTGLGAATGAAVDQQKRWRGALAGGGIGAALGAAAGHVSAHLTKKRHPGTGGRLLQSAPGEYELHTTATSRGMNKDYAQFHVNHPGLDRYDHHIKPGDNGVNNVLRGRQFHAFGHDDIRDPAEWRAVHHKEFHDLHHHDNVKREIRIIPQVHLPHHLRHLEVDPSVVDDPKYKEFIAGMARAHKKGAEYSHSVGGAPKWKYKLRHRVDPDTMETHKWHR